MVAHLADHAHKLESLVSDLLDLGRRRGYSVGKSRSRAAEPSLVSKLIAVP